jgi:hypothetical protein
MRENRLTCFKIWRRYHSHFNYTYISELTTAILPHITISNIDVIVMLLITEVRFNIEFGRYQTQELKEEIRRGIYMESRSLPVELQGVLSLVVGK